MKICIVTVHKTINIGSFWQAYALGMILKKMGHEVYYLEYDISERIKKAYHDIKLFFALMYHRGLKDALIYKKSLIQFVKAQKQFDIISRKSKKFREIDAVVLGSDTIWNFNNDFFLRNRDVFSGKLFLKKKVYAYAASASNTEKETLEKYSDFCHALKNMEAIAVRDSHTKGIVEGLCGRSAEIVCDPTLLLTKKQYMDILKITNSGISEKYLFLYLFEPLDMEQEKNVVAFAKNRGLKIINEHGTRNAPYADVTIVDCPENFIRYILFAEYVITDTFHGTIFSINFNKQFCAINRNKVPVNDAMYDFGLEDYLINKKCMISAMLEKTINYSIVNSKVESRRKHSMDYLRELELENAD